MNFQPNKFIYFEGDPIDYIYILSKGSCSMVLPKFDNKAYLKVEIGNTFGVVDIMGSCIKNDLDFDEWFNNKN